MTAQQKMRNLTNLPNGQMAESANEFGFVERISGHFHTTHGLHVLVHPQQLRPRHLHLEVGRVAEMRLERVFMESNEEGLREVGRLVVQLCGIRRRLDAANLEAESGWLMVRIIPAWSKLSLIDD